MAYGTLWTDNEVDRLKACLARNMTYDEIADALGRTSKSVGNKVKHLRQIARGDVETLEVIAIEDRPTKATNKKPLKWSEMELELLVRLIADGLSQAQIADRLRRSVASVRNMMKNVPSKEIRSEAHARAQQPSPLAEPSEAELRLIASLRAKGLSAIAAADNARAYLARRRAA